MDSVNMQIERLVRENVELKERVKRRDDTISNLDEDAYKLKNDNTGLNTMIKNLNNAMLENLNLLNSKNIVINNITKELDTLKESKTKQTKPSNVNNDVVVKKFNTCIVSLVLTLIYIHFANLVLFIPPLAVGFAYTVLICFLSIYVFV